MLFLGIMSQQKQNFLWLMIVCCASHQITCSKKLKIQANSTDTCFWKTSISTTYPAINWECLSDYGILDENSHMNVTLNISSQGQCKTYSFNITNNGNQCEVRMNETFAGIKLWIFPNVNCLAPFGWNEMGMICHEIGSSSNDQGCWRTPSVDPEERCRNALYDNNTCRERSTYILSFNNQEWRCVTCSKSQTSTASEGNGNYHLKPHEKIYNITRVDLEDKDGVVDSSKASDALEELDTLFEQMEKDNTRNAGLAIGNAIGVLQIQDKNTETKDTCYASDPNIVNVVDCQSVPNVSWSVKISKEAFNKSRLENNGKAFLGVLRFNNMGNKSVLNNEVYGITMKANISNLTDNIEMFFTKKDLVGEASCSSWDGKGNLTWTTSGCETEKVDNNTIKCSCSHLTFFAVLMSPTDVNANITAPYVDSLSFITSIGSGISMFFLSVALFMHFLLRKAKSNQATKILMNMFVALFLLNLSFLSNESIANTEVKAACVFIALLMHYSMLTTFTWFFMQALHMYLWLIRQNVTITNYMRKITVFGWTFPAPIVVAVVSIGGFKSVIINTTSGKTTQMCWITDPFIHYIVNIGYYALVFIFTSGIFITICTRIVQTRRRRAADGKKKTFRKQLMMVLSLFLLFGLTWAVAFFSYGAMLIPSYYIFTVLNSFQGFFLFLYYYHIHKDIEGCFSDDPERSSSTTTIVQSKNNAVENVNNQPK
ncbi:adhesion G-protein coupled receptor G2-like isoform X2 [Megalobrama amblycephala]|uniref:adhesion G-protein coupled receptor G2-like isoform X2 n=1 Tax=Megalobrama amblycephala TaxID=75352 RepID=UPI002013DF7B|nr:adhesion G-protein coupled receptor G2-like isoform X2 [Megalobrama amblycephala]